MQFIKKPGTITGMMVLVFFLSTPVTHAHENSAEMLAQLESLQQQINALKAQLEQTQTQAVETDAKVEAVAEVIESTPAQVAEASKVTIGGYGELHYNN